MSAPSQLDGVTPYDRGSILRFLRDAMLWNIALFAVIRLPWVTDRVIGALIDFQTTLIAWYGAKASPGIVVAANCSGADVAALCIGVTLSYPVAWRRRIAGAAIGVAAIIAVNAVRIALEVHPPHRAASLVGRHVDLHDARVEPALFELADAERPRERATLVAATLEVQDPGAAELGLREDHSRTSRRGMGSTNLQPHSRTCAICSMISSRMFHGRMSR